MIPVYQLLLRFKGLVNTEKIKKEQIVELLSQKNIKVNTKQIYFSKKTVFIKTDPITKTEILFNKEEILNEMKEVFGEGGYIEIK